MINFIHSCGPYTFYINIGKNFVTRNEPFSKYINETIKFYMKIHKSSKKFLNASDINIF